MAIPVHMCMTRRHAAFGGRSSCGSVAPGTSVNPFKPAPLVSIGAHWATQPRANRFTSHLGRWRRFVSCLALRLRFGVAHKMKINWPGVRTHSTPAFWLHTSAACPGAVLAPQGAPALQHVTQQVKLRARGGAVPPGAHSSGPLSLEGTQHNMAAASKSAVRGNVCI